MTPHVDELLLLQYLAGELAPEERKDAARHVTACDACQTTVVELATLDGELRRLTAAGAFLDETAEFAPDDPFRQRPRPGRPRNAPISRAPDLIASAVTASDSALFSQRHILESVTDPERLRKVLAALSLDDPEHRFRLLYALQEAGRTIAQDPISARKFAHAVLTRLSDQRAEGDGGVAEGLVPWHGLIAQAHVLAALSCMWTKEFTQARASLLVAYRSFGRVGDETGLAIVELTEAQRRAFTHEGRTALVLARRARTTFEARGLEDLAARAMVAEGLSHFDLDRQDEAVASYRRALPIFERYRLWSNYIGALNSIGTSLTKVGRFDEARREYARALRRFSREADQYWIGYLRTGLAEALFAAGRYSEAAISAGRAAQVFSELGLRANALIALLLEIEAWVRYGNIARAQHRMELFSVEFTRDQTLDATVVRELADALAGMYPDYERLALLRHRLEEVLQPRATA